ncbi:MAG: EAL domain-containing protein [Rhodospirillales bacterium]|nr:EAL domain-containing protein [Rhodospirillales bacterium]
MAFQPIVDLGAGRVRAYEALVRGPHSEPAATVLAQLTPTNVYAFDQAARVRAIELAAQLGIAERNASVSINFKPGAMYRPQSCVRPTLAAARRTGFPPDRIVFELTEDERVGDFAFLREIFEVYRANRFSTAIDDFGAGYAGLTLLAEYQPDWVKLDMALVRGLDGDAARRAIVAAAVGMCGALGVGLIAEGVETRAELDALRSLGVTVFQGYLFARPAFERLPDVAL